MNIGNEIRKLAIDDAKTLTFLANCISEKMQKPYSVQNLSIKLKKGTINANEISIMVEALGYNVHFIKAQ